MATEAATTPAPPIPPNNTIYVNNLNERVNVEELKKALSHVFAQFGKILEIQASKTLKRRGQAWVIFDNVKSAEKSLKEMQGFNFYNKPMRLAFAKVKSDVVAKRDGTFVPRPEKKHKKKKGKKRKVETKETKKQNGKSKKSAPPAPHSAAPTIRGMAGVVPGMNPAPMSFPPRAPAGPNRVLFVENLPLQCSAEELNAIFGGKPGFRDTRVIGVRNVAFVDFENEYTATMAMNQLGDEVEIRGQPITISYAKQ